jgi:hypothetical protein
MTQKERRSTFGDLVTYALNKVIVNACVIKITGKRTRGGHGRTSNRSRVRKP